MIIGRRNQRWYCFGYSINTKRLFSYAQMHIKMLLVDWTSRYHRYFPFPWRVHYNIHTLYPETEWILGKK